MDKEAFASVVLSSTDSLYRISKSILKYDADCEDAEIGRASCRERV